MITSLQAERLTKQGKLKKTFLKNHFGKKYLVYYSQEQFPNLELCEQVAKVNDMKLMLGEWWEFYHSRVDNLKNAGIIDAIPVITREECISCGL